MMTDDRRLIEIPQSDYQVVAPDAQAKPGLAHALARLAVGGVLAGQQELTRRLRLDTVPPDADDQSAALKAAPAASLVGYASLGAAQSASGIVQRSVTAAAELTLASGKLGWRLARPVVMSRALSPVRRQAATMAREGEKTLDRWATMGYAEQEQGRSLAGSFTASVIDAVVAYLTDNETVAALIDAQAGRYLRGLTESAEVQELIKAQAGLYLSYLNEHPEAVAELVEIQVGKYLAYLKEHPDEIAGLVQQQGDKYIDYLNANPDSVQDLLQGQSIGLATEMVGDVRQRSATADAGLEMIIRSLLRRPPRDELPEPPPEVQALAAMGRKPLRRPVREPQQDKGTTK